VALQRYCAAQVVLTQRTAHGPTARPALTMCSSWGKVRPIRAMSIGPILC
jgi:hypothetical protein